MTRNIKILCLTLAVAAMLGAAAAPSASAIGKFTAANYPQHLVGTTAGEQGRFTLNGNYFGCPGFSHTSWVSGAASHLTAAPAFGNCSTITGEETLGATIHSNECTFTFKVTATGGADEHTGALDVVCPGSKTLEYRHMTTCNVTIPSQAGKGTVTYTNVTASKDLLFEGEISLGGLMHGNCSFGFTLNVSMVFHLNTTVQATSGEAIHIGEDGRPS